MQCIAPKLTKVICFWLHACLLAFSITRFICNCLQATYFCPKVQPSIYTHLPAPIQSMFCFASDGQAPHWVLQKGQQPFAWGQLSDSPYLWWSTGTKATFPWAKKSICCFPAHYAPNLSNCIRFSWFYQATICSNSSPPTEVGSSGPISASFPRHPSPNVIIPPLPTIKASPFSTLMPISATKMQVWQKNRLFPWSISSFEL